MGRALVRDPDVFLFDEPLSNLDAKLRVDMRTEIKKLIPVSIDVMKGKPVAVISGRWEGAKLPVAQEFLTERKGQIVKMGIRPEAIVDEGSADMSSALMAKMQNVMKSQNPQARILLFHEIE